MKNRDTSKKELAAMAVFISCLHVVANMCFELKILNGLIARI